LRFHSKYSLCSNTVKNIAGAKKREKLAEEEASLGFGVWRLRLFSGFGTNPKPQTPNSKPFTFGR